MQNSVGRQVRAVVRAVVRAATVRAHKIAAYS